MKPFFLISYLIGAVPYDNSFTLLPQLFILNIDELIESANDIILSVDKICVGMDTGFSCDLLVVGRRRLRLTLAQFNFGQNKNPT